MRADAYGRIVRQLILSQSSRRAAIYLVSTLANLAIPLLLLPLLTRYLTTGAYGRIATFQSLAAIAGAITLFGQNAPILRSFAVDPEQVRKNHLAASLAISAVLSLGIGLLVVGFAGELARVSSLPRSWVLAAALAGAASTALQLKLTTLRAGGRAAAYGVLVNAQTLINVTVSVLFIVVWEYSWMGRALGVLVSNVVTSGWALASFLGAGAIGRVIWRDVRGAAALGAAMTVHSIVGVLLANGDRLFLTASFNPQVAGVYAVAAQLAAGYAVIGTALNLAWSPWAFRQIAAMATEEQRRRLLGIAAALCTFIVLGAAGYGVMVALAFPLLVGAKYAGALAYLPILLGSVCFQNMFSIMVFPLFYYRRAMLLAAGGVSALALAVAGLALVSPHYGPMGVAGVVLAARLVMFVIAAVAAVFLLRRGLTRHLPGTVPVEDGVAS
jgi:O-antigen/teichoic acid export membrane protein